MFSQRNKIRQNFRNDYLKGWEGAQQLGKEMIQDWKKLAAEILPRGFARGMPAALICRSEPKYWVIWIVSKTVSTLFTK